MVHFIKYVVVLPCKERSFVVLFVGMAFFGGNGFNVFGWITFRSRNGAGDGPKSIQFKFNSIPHGVFIISLISSGLKLIWNLGTNFQIVSTGNFIHYWKTLYNHWYNQTHTLSLNRNIKLSLLFLQLVIVRDALKCHHD
jgi:hypothetical protein